MNFKNTKMSKLYKHEGEYYTEAAYFTLMFGSEFMKSNDKGEIKTYEDE